jgi:hypothetical protein
MGPEYFIARGIQNDLPSEDGLGPNGIAHGRGWYASPLEMATLAPAQLRPYARPISRDRGYHYYTIKVPQTSNMYLCFRCGEPGWDVPPREAAHFDD